MWDNLYRFLVNGFKYNLSGNFWFIIGFMLLSYGVILAKRNKKVLENSYDCLEFLKKIIEHEKEFNIDSEYEYGRLFLDRLDYISLYLRIWVDLEKVKINFKEEIFKLHREKMNKVKEKIEGKL